MNAFGWPFLVGRGRRAGHRVLLAPDFLVTEHDHGILEASSVYTTELTSSAGRRLAVRCSTHQVSAEDVAAAGQPRDEHGRPLRLIYGVVATGVEPVNADLRVALESALDTYRRFLRREDDFEVVPSQAFPLTAPARRSMVDSAPAAVPGRRPGPRSVALLSGAALAAVLVIALTVLWGRSEPETGLKSPPPRCSTTTTTTTTTRPPGTSSQCGGATSSCDHRRLCGP
jgi:hypothetical protein